MIEIKINNEVVYTVNDYDEFILLYYIPPSEIQEDLERRYLLKGENLIKRNVDAFLKEICKTYSDILSEIVNGELLNQDIEEHSHKVLYSINDLVKDSENNVFKALLDLFEVSINEEGEEVTSIIYNDLSNSDQWVLVDNLNNLKGSFVEKLKINPDYTDRYSRDNPPKDLDEVYRNKKGDIIRGRRTDSGRLLQARSDPDYYLKPNPQENIFLSASTLGDGEVREWRAFNVWGQKLDKADGYPLTLILTKNELMGMSRHYELRKSAGYKARDDYLAEISFIKNDITKSEEQRIIEIEAFSAPYSAPE